jgi:transcriptional regulator with XRE-family HTH domain
MRRFRAIKNITQEALADLAKMDRAYVGGVERGDRNVSIDNLERLAKALGIEPWELLKPES